MQKLAAKSYTKNKQKQVKHYYFAQLFGVYGTLLLCTTARSLRNTITLHNSSESTGHLLCTTARSLRNTNTLHNCSESTELLLCTTARSLRNTYFTQLLGVYGTLTVHNCSESTELLLCTTARSLRNTYFT